MIFCRCLLALLLSALPVMATGTLEGRVVTLNAFAYDDAAAPIFESRGQTVVVGTGVEFGMGPEFTHPQVDVVPVQVEIGPTRIEFCYGEGEGVFLDSAFNGYVLRFAVNCALFASVMIDRQASTLPITLKDVRTEAGALFVNIAGQRYGPDVTLALDFVVGECLRG